MGVLAVAAIAVEVGFIAWDAYDIYNDPSNPWNYVSMASNFAGPAIGLAGKTTKIGKLAKLSSKTDELMDSAKLIGNFFNRVDNLNDASKIIDQAAYQGFKNEKLLMKHFVDHGAEFGVKSADEYGVAAKSFIKSSSEDILQHVRPNGDVVKYGVNTNEFSVVSKEGYIRTYFKPDEGIEYYMKDIRIRGKIE